MMLFLGMVLGVLLTLLWRTADFVIGEDYLRRWWVIPRNKFVNMYFHHILRDDDDRALHDHPWWNCSIILWGSYDEITPNGVKRRGVGSVTFRRAKDAHRLVVGEGSARTLFITGPEVRDWGFHCPKGWVPWQDFVAEHDKGKVGRGCGEV